MRPYLRELTVLIQYQLVTDGQTQDDSIYCANIASRGKNQPTCKEICLMNSAGRIFIYIYLVDSGL